MGGLDVSGIMAWMASENHALENLSYLATVIGLPVLVISYWTSLKAEAERREYGTYDALETKYVEFQRLTLRYPRLDIAEFPQAEAPTDLTAAEIVQQRTLYMILFSLFERAWLMYHTRRFWFLGRMRGHQWRGWESYIDKYCQREACAKAWFNYEAPKVDVRQDFDNRFERFIMARFKAAGRV